MSNTERPLSPHLTVYRWPMTMTLSILHRATGAVLSLGLIVLAYWLLSLSAGPAAYAKFAAQMSTLVGRVLLIGWSFAFFYHLANGIRHLFWDIGRGFEKRRANASAWFVLIAAVALTAAYWAVLL